MGLAAFVITKASRGSKDAILHIIVCRKKLRSYMQKAIDPIASH